MPNWCYNTLNIEGSSENAHRIMDAFSGDNPFSKIYPCPAELYDDEAHAYGGTDEDVAKQNARRAELKSKYGYDSAYDWHCGEWGTKWDVEPCVNDDSVLPNGNRYMNVYFDSAWSPPIELYRWINRTYPEVRLSWTYEEGGVGFQGEGSCEGDMFDDVISDYVYEDEEEEDDVFVQPETQATPNVGAATVLPLPGGTKK